MTPQLSTSVWQRKVVPFATTICSLVWNRYAVFLLCVYLYTLLTVLMGSLGGIVALSKNPDLMFYSFGDGTGLKLTHQYWELGLLLYLYSLGNLILRPSKLRPWLAGLPILFSYVGQDIYYLAYSNVFRFAELAEVPELLKVLSWPYLALLAVLVALPLGYFLYSINYRRPVVLIGGALPLALLIATVEFFPVQYTAGFQRVGQPIEFWSDGISAVNNGRMMMLLYREAERRITVAKTKAFRNRSEYDAQAQQLATWLRERNNQRNVHLIVLESFIDPTLFKNAKFTHDPLHPSFRKLFAKNWGFSLSPVFGGKTAQAEFEALCGVPAFGEMTGVEFNSFTGSAANCLPGVLEKAGYQTMASNAYNPNFFNTPNAYKGLGFAQMYFPREYGGNGSTYLHKGDTSGELGYMFDGDFFAQNLAFIAPLLQSPEHKPLFNYLLTIFGHVPHQLNKDKRPLVLKMRSTFKDQFLEWAANQIYYRSQAVADYVTQLMALDPQGLIILVSDHLPPGQYGLTSYQKLRYLDGSEESMHMNRIMIVEAGKVKKNVTIHHYDIPALIMDSITDGAYCREHSCGFAQNRLLDDRAARHNDYMRVMAHTSE
ncbi:MAG: LTA synthase family protein [Desulfobulbus sp.]|nr:LTA synthase family protein [Desulfobulbus sp.]